MVKTVTSRAKLSGFKSSDKTPFSWGLSLPCCDTGIPLIGQFEHLLGEQELQGGCLLCFLVSLYHVDSDCDWHLRGLPTGPREELPWPWCPALALPCASHDARHLIAAISSDAHGHLVRLALLLALGGGSSRAQGA